MANIELGSKEFDDDLEKLATIASFSVDYEIVDANWQESSVEVNARARYTIFGSNSSWFHNRLEVPYDPGHAQVNWASGSLRAEHSAFIDHSQPRKVLTRFHGRVTFDTFWGSVTRYFDKNDVAVEP